MPDRLLMSDTELRTTRVDISGLLTVLGEHIYSTPAIALRELVQNAHDSCVRRAVEDPAAPPGRITVRVEGHSLCIEDNGAGLLRQEIHDYLATVGTGYTRQLRAETGRDDLIGLFGLGFLSAFVVGEQVTVVTTSFMAPDEGHRYTSRGGERYAVELVPARAVGTVVRVDLRPDHRHLADAAVLRRLLSRYCALLRVPVWVDGDAVALNVEPPPWRAGAGEHGVQARQRRMAFASRFERRFEPLCTMDVTPGDGSDVRGLLWVQDAATYGTSDNRCVSAFVRGMLIDDDARELVPAWAGFVGGVVESVELTPTASREDLQRDARLAAATERIRAELTRGLAEVARRQPEAWRRVLSRHNEALLGAVIADAQLFDVAAKELLVPTTEGDLRVDEILRRGEGKAYVSLSARGGFEEMLCRALRVPVAMGTRYAVLPFLRRYTEARGGAVVELGTEGANRQLLRPAPLAEAEQRALAGILGRPGQIVVGARFQPASLPLVVIPDRDAELKKRLESDEADRRLGAATLRLARTFTAKVDGAVESRVYVNLDCPAVARLIEAIREGKPVARAGKLLRALVALLGGAGTGDDADLEPALAAFSEVMASIVDEEAR